MGLHPVLQLAELDGFDRIVIGTEAQGLDDVRGVIASGEHDDGELLVGVLGSQMSQGSKAIEPWHVDVEEHQVHGFRGHGLNGFGATVHGQGCVAYFLELAGNDDPVGVTVVDDENGSKLTHSALAHRDGTMPPPLSQYSRF